MIASSRSEVEFFFFENGNWIFFYRIPNNFGRGLVAREDFSSRKKVGSSWLNFFFVESWAISF